MAGQDFLEGMPSAQGIGTDTSNIDLAPNERIPHGIVLTLYMPKVPRHAWLTNKAGQRQMVMNMELYNPWTTHEGNRLNDVWVALQPEDVALLHATKKYNIVNSVNVYGHFIKTLIPTSKYDPSKGVLNQDTGVEGTVLEVPRNSIAFAWSAFNGMTKPVTWETIAQDMAQVLPGLEVPDSRHAMRLRGPNILNRFTGQAYVTKVEPPRADRFSKRLGAVAEAILFPASQNSDPVKILLEVRDNLTPEQLKERDQQSRAEFFHQGFEANGPTRLYVSSGSIRLDTRAAERGLIQYRVVSMSHHFLSSGAPSIGGGIIDADIGDVETDVDFTAGLTGVTPGETELSAEDADSGIPFDPDEELEEESEEKNGTK